MNHLPLRRLLTALACALAPPAITPAFEPVLLEVSAGKHARRDTPVSWEAESPFAPGTLLVLERLDAQGGGRAQVDPFEPRRVWWLLQGEIPAGTTRRYRLRQVDAVPLVVDPVESADDGKGITIKVWGQPVLRYRHALVEPPPGVEPVFARSGYLHPLWSPAGRVITNDFPLNHKHHHGVWFPWTRTVFEGREVDFWNSAVRQGKVECVKLDAHGGGPVFGHFRARHRHLDLTAPGGPKAALDEVWEVHVWALREHFVFDLVSVQTCASPSPLLLKEYRYGGLGFRGSGEWEGEHVEFLTSEGRTRQDGHATSARWCEVNGKVGGAPCGVSILCHPSNFRAPQRMRIHPSEPFFNFAPCQAGDFAIEPGKPYVSRYRFSVHDGPPDPQASERHWNDYAEPPRVAVIRDRRT